MDSFAVFTARGLRNRSGELLEDAEAGRVSLITNSGKPAILAIPFDDWILDHGVHRAMALNLFSSHQLTLAQSAKVADLSMEAFIELLGKADVLLAVKKGGFIDEVMPFVKSLGEIGYRMSQSLMIEIARLARETKVKVANIGIFAIPLMLLSLYVVRTTIIEH